MTTQEKFDLITRNLEEVLTPEDLMYFLENEIPLKHYIGFEISGQVHVGGGLITAMKMKDFYEAGVEIMLGCAAKQIIEEQAEAISNAFSEIEVTIEINDDWGVCKITHVNGREVEDC